MRLKWMVKTLSRASDITDLNGHLIRVLNEMDAQIHDLPRRVKADSPEVVFMLAGHSWMLAISEFSNTILTLEVEGFPRRRRAFIRKGRLERSIFTLWVITRTKREYGCMSFCALEES